MFRRRQTTFVPGVARLEGKLLLDGAGDVLPAAGPVDVVALYEDPPSPVSPAPVLPTGPDLSTGTTPPLYAPPAPPTTPPPPPPVGLPGGFPPMSPTDWLLFLNPSVGVTNVGGKIGVLYGPDGLPLP